MVWMWLAAAAAAVWDVTKSVGNAAWTVASWFFSIMWDGIKSVFSWIVFSAPTPIKIIFFVFLFFFFGGLVIGNTVGLTHACDSSGKLMEATNGYNDAILFKANLFISTFTGKKTDEQRMRSSFDPVAQPTGATDASACMVQYPAGTSFLVSKSNAVFWATESDFINSSRPLWYYSSACVNCAGDGNGKYIIPFGYGDSTQFRNLCSGDAYAWDSYSRIGDFGDPGSWASGRVDCNPDSWLGNWNSDYISSGARCVPKKGCYWRQSDNSYVKISDNSPCEETQSATNNNILSGVAASVAVKNQDVLKRQYFTYVKVKNDDIIGFKCEKNIDGKTYKDYADLSLAGIPIFDAKTMILVLLVIVVFSVYKFFK